MNTPVADFVRDYVGGNRIRLHMPGHKGKTFLGCEGWDITEVAGADALYEAEGIIAQSEENAARLFGTARTFYSTEGSSQTIRAMVYLACRQHTSGERPWFLAARNAHKAFLYGLALADADVTWLWPEKTNSLCACPVTAHQVEQALLTASTLPAAVYITTPDYLGNRQPVAEIAAVCHRFGTLLLVDNAHGAYLHFLPQSEHPMALGADLCCDSAHKTLPVLTGGAYLHVRRNAPGGLAEAGKQALAIFGSTSPSYLTLASLDRCNSDLADDFPRRLREAVRQIEKTRVRLESRGWQVLPTEVLKITIRCPGTLPGPELAQRLRRAGIECEYADRDHLVLMPSAETTPEELAALEAGLGENVWGAAAETDLPFSPPEQSCTIRAAVFAPQETVTTAEALGRIAAAPTVGCPPAIPIVVSGERIDEPALALLAYYGIDRVAVLR